MADTDDVDRSHPDSSGGPTPGKGVNPTTDAASAEPAQGPAKESAKKSGKKFGMKPSEDQAEDHVEHPGDEQGVGKGTTARKGRPTRKQRRSERGGQHDSIAKAPPPNPTWFVPVMLGLMIIGLLWVVVFYLSNGQWPVSAWHNWNLLIGFAFIVAGFIMTTRWR